MLFVIGVISFLFALAYSATSPLGSFRLLITTYLVVPTALGFRPPSGFPLPIVSIARTYFAGFLLGYVVNRMFAAVPKRRVPSIAIYFAIYVVYLFATSYFSASREWDLKVLLSEKVVGGMVIFFIAYSVVRREDDFLFLLRGLYTGVIIVALIAFGEAATGTRFNNLPAMRSLSALDPATFTRTVGGTGFAERGGLIRVESTYEHSIYLGLALTMVLPFLLTVRERMRRTLSAIATWSAVLASILTVSRTAWFSVVAAAFPAGKKRRTLLVMALLALLLLGVPFLTSSFQEASYVDKSAFGMGSRVSLLVNTLQNVSPRTALFGIGLGGLDHLLSDYQSGLSFLLRTRSLQRLPSDNSLAASLLTIGLVGTTLFLLIFYRLARILYAMARISSDTRTLLLRSTLYCLIIQLAIFLISNSVFQNGRLSVVFFALLGSALGVATVTTDMAGGVNARDQRAPVPTENRDALDR